MSYSVWLNHVSTLLPEHCIPFQFLQGRPPKLDYCHKNMSFIELTWTILIQMSFHMKTIKIKKGFSEFDVACIVLTLESNICSSIASYSSSCDTSNDNWYFVRQSQISLCIPEHQDRKQSYTVYKLTGSEVEGCFFGYLFHVKELLMCIFSSHVHIFFSKDGGHTFSLVIHLVLRIWCSVKMIFNG